MHQLRVYLFRAVNDLAPALLLFHHMMAAALAGLLAFQPQQREIRLDGFAVGVEECAVPGRGAELRRSQQLEHAGHMAFQTATEESNEELDGVGRETLSATQR